MMITESACRARWKDEIHWHFCKGHDYFGRCLCPCGATHTRETKKDP